MESNDRLSTKEDVEKFVRWLADPKFRQLFETFVKTATDSEEKSKFEADTSRIRKQDEIIRLDFNNPADPSSSEEQIPLKVDPTTQQVFIRPDRGFCLVTRTRIYKDYKFDKELPLIINICHHKAIESAQLIHRHTNCGHDHAHVPEEHEHDGSDVYKVPYSLGPAIKLKYRTEVAKVYDCVFSSKTYQEFKNDDKKRAVLIETALKAVKEQYSENPMKEYSILPEVDYFEEEKKPNGEPTKNDIIRAMPSVMAETETFKKNPIERCQTPLMTSNLRAAMFKSIIDHIKGDNQFHVLISAHNNTPPTVIRQLDNFIQIRVDDIPLEATPILQLNECTLEVNIQNSSSEIVYQLQLEFSHQGNENGSYWTYKAGCLIVNLRKQQSVLWNRILNL